MFGQRVRYGTIEYIHGELDIGTIDAHGRLNAQHLQKIGIEQTRYQEEKEEEENEMK